MTPTIFLKLYSLQNMQVYNFYLEHIPKKNQLRALLWVRGMGKLSSKVLF